MRLPLLFVAATAALSLAGCAEPEPLEPDRATVPTAPAGPGGALPLAAVVTDVWGAKAAMPTARTGAAVGVVGSVLYALGGSNGTPLATVEAYTISTNSWTPKAALPQARSNLNGAGVINGVLYVAGGVSSAGLFTALSVRARGLCLTPRRPSR